MRDKVEEWNLLNIIVMLANIGNNSNAVDLVDRELVDDVESADRIYLVAKEVDTVWIVVRIRENINDAAT